MQALNGKWPDNKKQKVRIEKLIPSFSIKTTRLFYNIKVEVPEKLCRIACKLFEILKSVVILNLQNVRLD